MTLKEIYDMLCTGLPRIGIFLFIILSVIEITPIKVNPWGKILGGIGKIFNRDIQKGIADLRQDVKDLRQETNNMVLDLHERINIIDQRLDQHIMESDQRDVRLRRESILDFASAVANGRNYTKEQYEQMLRECDDYENYCEKKQIKNSVAEASIGIIINTYQEHLAHNDFLASRFASQIMEEALQNGQTLAGRID